MEQEVRNRYFMTSIISHPPNVEIRNQLCLIHSGKKYAQITAGVVHAERTRARKKKGLKKRSGEINF